jgi:hypothetical protein
MSQPVGFSTQNCQFSNSNMQSNIGSNQESLENIFKYPTQADANNSRSSINFPRGTNTKRGFARDAQNQQSTESQFSNQGVGFESRHVHAVGSIYNNTTSTANGSGGGNKFQIHPLLQGNMKSSLLHQQ